MTGPSIELMGAEAQTHLLGPRAGCHTISAAIVVEVDEGTTTDELLGGLKRRIASGLDLAPRMQKVVVDLPVRGPGHALVDGPPIDLDAHVQVAGADRTVSLERFCDLTLALTDQPLDLDRPLWRVWLVPHLEDNRAGVIFSVHHFIQDGIMGMASAAFLLLDERADAPLRQPPPYEPAPMPTDAQLRAAARSRPHPAREYLRRLDLHPRRLGQMIKDMRHVYRDELALQPSDLLARKSDDRGLTVVQIPADDVRRCQDELGHHVSFNDVAVTMLVGAIGRLVAGRDVAGQRLLVDVPVTLSLQDGGDDDWDRRAAMMVLSLPLDETDPLRLLAEVNRQSRARKSTEAHQMAELMTVVSLLPFPLFDRISGALWSRGNLLFSDIPGPSEDIYVTGHRVQSAFGVGNLKGRSALRVVVGSFGSQVSFGTVYDRRVVDIDRFDEALRDVLAGLSAAQPTT